MQINRHRAGKIAEGKITERTMQINRHRAGKIAEGKIKLRPTRAQKVCLHIGLARHTSRCAVGRTRPPHRTCTVALGASGKFA
jgi:hypothetical protein